MRHIVEWRGPKRPDGSYRVVVVVPSEMSERTGGYAHQVVDNWGRKRGWVIRNSAGVVILGSGQSTKIGNGLGDACFMFEKALDEGQVTLDDDDD